MPEPIPHCGCMWYDIIGKGILPRAEVPRDLDIVPLPPGPFYIKIELFFLFNNLLMYIEQNSIAFVLTFVVKYRNTKYCQFVGRKVLNS